MTEKTCSDSLAQWISTLTLADISDAARIATEDTVIDTVGLTIAALETDYGQAVREAFHTSGSCTVWGLSGSVEMVGAAVINGTCGHGEDFDNTFEGCPGAFGRRDRASGFCGCRSDGAVQGGCGQRACRRDRGREPLGRDLGQGRAHGRVSPNGYSWHYGGCRRCRGRHGADTAANPGQLGGGRVDVGGHHRISGRRKLDQAHACGLGGAIGHTRGTNGCCWFSRSGDCV